MSRRLGILLVLAVLVLVPLASAGPTGPGDFTTVQVATGDGGGTMGTMDYDPADPAHWMWALCTDDGSGNFSGVYESTDSGATWSFNQVGQDGHSAGESCDVEFHPTEEGLVAYCWFSIDPSSNVKVGVSEDGGSTWSVASEVLVSRDCALHWGGETGSGFRLTVLGHDASERFKVANSNDTGQTWNNERTLFTEGTNNPATKQFANDLQHVHLAPGFTAFLTETQLFTSQDAGVTWTNRNNNLTSELGFSSLDGYTWTTVDQSTFYVGVWESSGSNPFNAKLGKTTDGGDTWTAVREWDDTMLFRDGEDNRGDVISFGAQNSTQSMYEMVFSEDGGSSWEVVRPFEVGECGTSNCSGSEGALMMTGDGRYVASDRPSSADGSWVAFTEDGQFQLSGVVAEPVPGPEPVDFAQGLKDAVVSLGFRTAQSQMFFALAVIGITTVATGTALKWMSPGKTKNWLIAGAAMGVGAFFVLTFFMDFWMLIISIVVGAAIVAGPQRFVNTLGDLKREAEGVVGGEPVPGSETVADPEAPGMVDLPEGTEMVDLPEGTEMVETTAQVDVGEGAEMIDVGDAEDVEV